MPNSDETLQRIRESAAARKFRERKERLDAQLEKSQADPYGGDRHRYLPASYRARDELAALIGEARADAVKALIEAMIQERHD